MLGILVGTDDGLLQIVPGEETVRALEGRPVTSLDYRGGVAIAGVRGQGVWVHLTEDWKQLTRSLAAGWAQIWDGDPRCVRAAPGGERYIGAAPAAVFSSFPGTATTNELGALRGTLQADRQTLTPPGAEEPYVAAIAFPDRGPEEALFIGVAGSGVWRAQDTHRDLSFGSFAKRSDGIDSMIHGLWAHPERSDRLFVSTASGLHRTDDGGATWVQSISGLDRGWAGDLAVMPGAPDTLVLACARREPGKEAALFRSANGGLSWTRLMLDGEDEWERLPLLARLWDSDDTVFAAAGDKLWGSHDTGRNWVMLADGLPPARAIAAAL